MGEIKYGCQTYTWQMSYEVYSQKLKAIMGVISDSGLSGIEPEICMLGAYNNAPEKLAIDLEKESLTLSAMCLVCDWRENGESAAERVEADRVFDMLKKHFPGTLLALCQMPGNDREHLRTRQDNCIACISDIGQRAADAGVLSAFHPNSPEGSVFRTQEDYTYLIDKLNTEIVGFAPDFGHIARGGMDPVDLCRQYVSEIRHVHFKDMSKKGVWAEMGNGTIDFRGIVNVLADAGYDGWIMVEDESPRAEVEPDAVTLENGDFIKRVFLRGD